MAARALINDYETCQSWLHLANVGSISNDAHAVEAMVKQEAQQLGQHWSLISKWTSYVAIEREGAAVQHISIRRAGIIEASDLVRPRSRVWAIRPSRRMLPPTWARDLPKAGNSMARLENIPVSSITDLNISRRPFREYNRPYTPAIPANCK